MNNLRSFLLAIASLILLSQTAQAHYDPIIGRFINRDPIAEEGGLNLYGFVENKPIFGVDILGMRNLTYVPPYPTKPSKPEHECCVTGIKRIRFRNEDSITIPTTGWYFLKDRTHAGVDLWGRAVKIQIDVTYSGGKDCGLTQTMTHGDSSKDFLADTAARATPPLNSLSNGVAATDGFDSSDIHYNDANNTMSMFDAPSVFGSENLAAGRMSGYIDFKTCFHSSGQCCQFTSCCVEWRWSLDYSIPTGEKVWRDGIKVRLFAPRAKSKISIIRSYCEK